MCMNQCPSCTKKASEDCQSEYPGVRFSPSDSDPLLEAGTPVTFDLGDGVCHGVGVICGLATNGVPVLGRSYIVRYTELSVPWQYPCIAVFESHLRVNG
jgi:hypothetical protein